MKDDRGNEPNNKPNNNLNRKIILNLIFLVVSILAITIVIALVQNIESQNNKEQNWSDLVSKIRDDQVSEIEISENNDRLFVKVYKDDNRDRNSTDTLEYANLALGTQNTVVQELNNNLEEDNQFNVGSGEGEIIISKRETPWYVSLINNSIIQNLIILLLIIGVGLYLIRRISDANNKTISFGNSRARNYDELDGKAKITFNDVAGNEEAKQELNEVVDFLKRPEEYIKMGAKIPKGVLLVGSPGNGKTLMAKAIAGEANAPFLYVSGSEFVEMFVGVGAGRVRDLFRKAKKKSPCVIFIDEIDAVGRQRGAGLGGGNDEREQTLNQILVEMDGFEPNTYIIVIGATNRPDVLDPALLRPGRFDRQITVTAPDRKEREQILKVHSRNKKLAKNLDLSIVAKRTAGFSAADLMNVLNEAAILAVRGKKAKIDNESLREAVEKVILGPSLKSKIITEKQKKLTAYHEAGHALIQTVLPKSHKVQKVTIIPRGRAAGYTFAADNENDAITRTKSEFMADITSLFGGYVVEEAVFGEVSTGASNDLAKATETARNMVTKFGMSKLGPISFDDDKGMTFLGKDMVESKHYSEDSARQIDAEISNILKECYNSSKEIVKSFRKHLDKIANTLIEKEVLEYEEFTELVCDIVDVGIPA
ncbi:MAG: ATP-dependent zinc metalloprotease FtsH [Patescibacteria group bacterium]